MQIIFGSENAELLRNRHVVLELEAFDMGQGTKAAYCVLPQDAIPVEQLADLARLQRLHQGVVDALKRGDNALVLEGIQHLRGKFKGELDSFYDIISERLQGK